jgi:hypothetical protein
MTKKVWIELEFEVEFDYHPGEDQTRDYPGSPEEVEVTSIKCCDPLTSGELTITPYATGLPPLLQKRLAREVESIEEDCLKQVHESAEDPRI